MCVSRIVGFEVFVQRFSATILVFRITVTKLYLIHQIKATTFKNLYCNRYSQISNNRFSLLPARCARQLARSCRQLSVVAKSTLD